MTSLVARSLARCMLFLLAPGGGEVGVASAQEVPYLSGRIVDLADLIPDDEQRGIETKLQAFERETGTQIVVLTVPSLEGGDIEEFASRVGEAWRIGRREFDDGVLFLVAREDRRMRIEVGYGLEGALTDAHSRRILDHFVSPRFRAGQFAEGVDAGVDAIMAGVRGEFPDPDGRRSIAGDTRTEIMVLLLILALFLLFTSLLAWRAERRQRAWSSRSGWARTRSMRPGRGSPSVVVLEPPGRSSQLPRRPPTRTRSRPTRGRRSRFRGGGGRFGGGGA